MFQIFCDRIIANCWEYDVPSGCITSENFFAIIFLIFSVTDLVDLDKIFCKEYNLSQPSVYLILSFSDKFLGISTYRLTYLLTPWSRIVLEKLTGSQLVKKFPSFYETRRFITAFTSARHLSLSWATSIQSMLSHLTPWKSTLTL